VSIVKDLREALQDVVAPDLKAVVQGLAELRADVKEGNAQLRAEMRDGNAQLRAEMRDGIAQLRAEMKDGNTLLRTEIAAAEKRGVERDDRAEHRLNERLDSLQKRIQIADLTRRNLELEQALDAARKASKAEHQQH
jgi:putative component of toxin-antitoxin plasmid stabilization module